MAQGSMHFVCDAFCDCPCCKAPGLREHDLPAVCTAPKLQKHFRYLSRFPGACLPADYHYLG